MKKFIVVLMSIIALVALTATSPAFAGSVTSADQEKIFNKLLNKYSPVVQNETRSQCSESIEKCLNIAPIFLKVGKQNFLVIGNSLPFFGANKPYCWLFEKSAKGMRQILDFELCDEVSTLEPNHHGYQDVRDVMKIGAAGHIFMRFFRYDGSHYKEIVKERLNFN